MKKIITRTVAIIIYLTVFVISSLYNSPLAGAAIYSIWQPSDIPANENAWSATPLELGTKFRSNVNGSVLGIRYYRGTLQTGGNPQVGTLWTSSGVALGSVTMVNTTPSGWQTTYFANPIPISANTTYIISYNAQNNHYAADNSYFQASGHTNGPLTALQDGLDGFNGLFADSALSSTFPTSSWQSANYWVDVIFDDSLTGGITSDSTLTQQLNPGTISTSISDESGNLVSSPVFTMSPLVLSTSGQTSTGILGTNGQRIMVDNPGASINGGAWNLSISATNPASDMWNDGNGHTYLYNGTSATGQLTVNPGTATLVANTGGTAGISLGTSNTFSGNSPITLIDASTSASAFWNGYITGVVMSQSIPAGQPVGNYTLPMTQTVVVQ